MPATEASAVTHTSQPLRWVWVGGAVLIGSVLISVFILVVDPQLQRPVVAGFITTLSLMVVGILVGYSSRGETIRETAVAGLLLTALVGIAAVTVLKLPIPTPVWLISPFYAAALSMAGGWVGELMQGTLEEAFIDETVDWPWVFASVVIGFTLSAYAVFLGQALLGPSPLQLLWAFAGSFLVTGWIVGFFSPGVTMIEPAIAATGMIVLESGLVIIWFEGVPGQTLLAGFAAGIVLAYLGGWLGELSQKWKERRRKGAVGHQRLS